MFKTSSIICAIISLFFISQSTTAKESQTVSFSNRIVVKETVQNKEITKCPPGGKTCNVTLTLHDNGGFSSEVTESFTVPTTSDPTYQLDPSDYIYGTTDLNIIINRISQDLLSGVGVPVLP
ncbi:MAG TPA: hypothetical protein VGD89_05240 [Flavipsychrobacter sp.]